MAEGGGTSSRRLLSPQERLVMSLVVNGCLYKEIAARRGISEATVAAHVGSAIRKLGARTRAEAIAIGLRRGVLRLRLRVR